MSAYSECTFISAVVAVADRSARMQSGGSPSPPSDDAPAPDDTWWALHNAWQDWQAVRMARRFAEARDHVGRVFFEFRLLSRAWATWQLARRLGRESDARAGSFARRAASRRAFRGWEAHTRLGRAARAVERQRAARLQRDAWSLWAAAYRSRVAEQLRLRAERRMRSDALQRWLGAAQQRREADARAATAAAFSLSWAARRAMRRWRRLARGRTLRAMFIMERHLSRVWFDRWARAAELGRLLAAAALRRLSARQAERHLHAWRAVAKREAARTRRAMQLAAQLHRTRVRARVFARLRAAALRRRSPPKPARPPRLLASQAAGAAAADRRRGSARAARAGRADALLVAVPTWA